MNSTFNMPKVTVIIPNYNHAQYLDIRIQTVLGQTYQDFEVIIMDDCSTDNSREIIDTYAHQDKRISTVYNEINSGSTFKQWNKGIKLAKGEYIWIAESDDFADKYLLERLSEKLDKFLTAGIAYCQSWIVDEEDKILHSAGKFTEKFSKDRWNKDYFNTGAEECREFMMIQNTIPNASAVLLRKTFYEKSGMADESLKYAGDWMQWVKMLLISDVVFVAEHLNYFRKHSITTRYTSFENFKELVEFYKVFQLISKHFIIQPEKFKNVYLNKRWKLAYNNSFNKMALRNLLAIYHIAQPIDPYIKQRIFEYLFVIMKRNLKKITSYNKFIPGIT